VDGAEDYSVYTWEPSTGVSGNAIAGWTFSPNETTVYTLKASQEDGDFCTVKIPVAINVIPQPTQMELEMSEEQSCNAQPVSIEAKGAHVEGVVTIGDGQDLTDSTSNGPASFNNRWTSFRTQTIYTAAELNASGVKAGLIKSLAYNITTNGDGTTNADYTIKIGTTENGSYSNNSFYNTANYTTVYGPATYTHDATLGWNEIVFTAPFIWDGTSNIVIDVYMRGANSTNSARTYYTTSTNAAIAYWNVSSTSTSGERSNQKLNIRLNAFVDADVTWSPLLDLYEDALATVPYSGDVRRKVYYKSSVENTAEITATAKRLEGIGCPKTVTQTVITQFVNPPIVAPQLFCEAVSVDQIIVDSDIDNELKWYATETSSAVLNSITSTGTYFVEASRAGCVSERVPVLIDIIGP